MGIFPQPADETLDESLIEGWSVAFVFGEMQASLRFDSFVDGAVQQRLLLMGFSMRFKGGWGLQLALGSRIGGDLIVDAERLSFHPGFAGRLGVSIRFMEQEEGFPFVESSLGVAVVMGSIDIRSGDEPAEDASDWMALDVSLDARFGWTLWDFWTPYVALRVFGGPVWWQDDAISRVGSDVHHYQVALGTTLNLPKSIDVFGEWSLPLGERGFNVGLGYHF